MDPIVSLDNEQLTAQPGGQAQCVVTIRNLGAIVDGFRIEVLGEEVRGWAEVDPPAVEVYPEQDSTAVVVFSPPAGAPSGSFPFGVRAESVVDNDISNVAEGDLRVEKVIDVQGTITPATATGRWRTSHFVKLSNKSNAPLRMRLTASDPDNRLAFLLAPDTLDLPAGGAGHSQLRVKTRKPFLRGTPTRLPFQVVAEPVADSETSSLGQGVPAPRATLDGALNQRPILSRFVVVVATIAVLALAGGIAWALTRPTAGPADLVKGPPDTPQLTALPADATSVLLRWTPQPNLTGYRIHQQTADGTTTDVTPVDGAVGSFTVTGLAAQTQTCYQLEAVRQDVASPLSARQCATTPVAAALPTEPAALPTDSDQLSVADVPSTPGSDAAGESGSAAAVGSEPPAGGTAASGQAAPDGSATDGSDVTAPSADAGTQVLTAGQFVAVVFVVPAADARALPRAQAYSDALTQSGVATGILHTTDYPEFRLNPGGDLAEAEAYVVYSGPYDSPAAANTFCAAHPRLASCLIRQPAPRGG